MAVSVAGQELKRARDISHRAQLTLQTVVGGQEWLGWAIRETKDVYPFGTEPGLVAGIQTGLHQRGTVLFPKLALVVSPRRLIELSEEDLEVLIRAENSSRKVSVRTGKILMANQLWTADDLAAGRQLITQLEVAEASVFQTLTLSDQVALFDLVDEGVEESEELAQYAVSYATNAAEFADLYRFALAVGQCASGEPLAVVARAQAIVEPLLWSSLRCPFVPQELDGEGIARIVRTWIDDGNVLGFPTLARGLREAARYAPEALVEPTTAREALAAYWSSSCEFLNEAEPGLTYSSQDGKQDFVRFDSPGARALVGRDRDLGTLTLRFFSSDVS